MSNAVLEINAAAIKHNISFFQSKLEVKTKLLVVVKAFSYGSDAVIISKILQQEHVDYLAVAYEQEGITLRNAGITLPIIVLHPQINNLDLYSTYQLEPSIYSNKILDQFISELQKKKISNYAIHLKFNTGLNRLGFQPEEIDPILLKIKNHNEITIRSVFSHLAASEDLLEQDFTNHQIAVFKKIQATVIKKLSYKPLFHLLNTSGILNYPTAQFDMVRLGIGLYGFANDTVITNALKNVLSLKSTISQIRYINKGESVSYNRSFKALKKTRIATVAIGYADGLSRKLGNNGSVLINKHQAKILGNICMDMIIVDVSSINCHVGDDVYLFNSQTMISSLCNTLETIPYELLTMVSQRVKRVLV